MHVTQTGKDFQMLRQSGWLAGCNEEFQTRLLRLASLRSYASGDMIYRCGDSCEGVYGILTGRAAISAPRDDGQDFLIHLAGPGFWIGDLALFSGLPRLVSVAAARPISCAFIAQSQLERFVGAYPDGIRDFYRLSYANFGLAIRLITNLSIPDNSRRVALRLVHYHEVFGRDWIEVSQPDLANMLAVSMPTLQRSLQGLARDGLIETGYGKLRVLDVEALRRRAQD